jgi:hypothetical protein
MWNNKMAATRNSYLTFDFMVVANESNEILYGDVTWTQSYKQILHDTFLYISNNKHGDRATVWSYSWKSECSRNMCWSKLMHSNVSLNCMTVNFISLEGKVNLKLSLSFSTWRNIGGVEIQLHAFLTSILDGGEWSASRSGRFTPRERALGTHWWASESSWTRWWREEFLAPAGNRTL